MTTPPDFDQLVGNDLEPGERERLHRVHDLLLAAGPPPELSPVASPQAPAENVYPLLPRRRWAAVAALAAALGVAAFGAGFLVGDRSDERAAPERIIGMAPPGGESDARASLAVFPKDDAGNWPMELTVRDLPPLGAGQSYELWLTRKGDLAASCGTFVVSGSKTVVPLNAPYRLRTFDGWVITRHGASEPLLTT
jgi:Anti-sigma-K factor rskA